MSGLTKRIDLHCDTLVMLSDGRLQGDLLHSSGQVDLSRLCASGAFLQFFAIFLKKSPDGDLEKSRQKYARVRAFLDESLKKYPDLFRLVTDRAGLDSLERSGGLGAVLTVEDGALIEDDPARLEELYRSGVRLITLTWNFENCLGYPNSDDPAVMAKGLKPFGLETVRRMNELGILVDVSHLSDGGFWDVMRISAKPPVASHSDARAVTGHRRNLTDAMIRALAEKGGVTGINLCPPFCGDDPGYTRLDDVVAHIRHIRDTGGIGVLALGSDFDGIPGKQEIADCGQFDRLASALQKAGFHESEIDKIWYENALRVIRDNFR